MISTAELRAVLEQYKLHGWDIRRVLGSKEFHELAVGLVGELESGVSFHEHEIDCIWFSRRSSIQGVAWELRRAAGTAYALVTVVPDESEGEAFEDRLRSLEDRLSETSVQQPGMDRLN